MGSQEEGKLHFKHANGAITTVDGKPCEKVATSGYFQRDNHYYHIKSPNDILHINSESPLINHLSEMVLFPEERLRPITKEVFDNQMTNIVLDLGLHKYFEK